MAIVKRPLKKSPYRLIRAFAACACSLTLALLLYQIDAFHEKIRQQRKEQHSPQNLLLRREQEKLKATGDEGEDAPPDIPHSEHRRFVLTLAGLTGETSRHQVMMETRVDWAPLGVAHFERLVEEAQFYDDCRIFRVVPGFVVQFGISGDPDVQREWKKTVLKDDPVNKSNERGTVSFATSGKDTRTTQLFINLGNNAALDGQGFSPIGRILDDGMNWVDKINSAHRQKPAQGKIVNQGNAYLQESFPDLSYIESIRPADGTDALTED